MKKVGIWIDKEKAHIVTLENETETLKTIMSEVEVFHPKGGSGSRFKGGPQDVVQDSKYLEREKHQLKVYFKNLAAIIKHADAIAIFGPADTYKKFHKELQDHYKTLHIKVRGVQNADSMTTNQTKALIRGFFKSIN